MRKNIYQWHRTLSLIIALPVVLWAASGFMHPLMTNIRPRVAQQTYTMPAIDTHYLLVPLQQALQKNGIDSIATVRIIQINGNCFYQLKIPGENILRYISTQSGNLLKDGDALYARYLASIFLQGAAKDSSHQGRLLASLDKPAGIVPNSTTTTAQETIPEHDCCINATASVVNNSKGAPVTNVQFLEHFDTEYKNINRLLPVYRVDFARPDGIRIYVETAQDRFGFAMDNKRAVFDKIFTLFHTMSWLDGLGKAKLAIEILIMLAAFLSTLMGIYIFFISKGKKVSGNKLVKARWNHRYTSIIASLFTLLFTFSGAYHAWEKFTPDTRDRYFVEPHFAAASIALNWNQLLSALKTTEYITNIGLVNINTTTYWQVYHAPARQRKPGSDKKPGSDFVKNMMVPAPDTWYVNTSDYSILPKGEQVYAAYMASQFSGHNADAIVQTTPVTKFEGEYGFVNKRLPVWKLSYATNSNERFYVETSTGKLSVRVDDKDLAEGYSFSFFHKHHFMDFAGKAWRDFSTMFWAAMQVAMVAIGMVLYLRYRKRQQKTV